MKLLDIPKFVGEYFYKESGIYYLQKGYVGALEEYIFDKKIERNNWVALKYQK